MRAECEALALVCAQLVQETKSLLKNDGIIRNVFQHLVIESGVNWAADHALREYMLEAPLRVTY